jgi:hypothetical protein
METLVIRDWGIYISLQNIFFNVSIKSLSTDASFLATSSLFSVKHLSYLTKERNFRSPSTILDGSIVYIFDWLAFEVT